MPEEMFRLFEGYLQGGNKHVGFVLLHLLHCDVGNLMWPCKITNPKEEGKRLMGTAQRERGRAFPLKKISMNGWRICWIMILHASKLINWENA